MIDVSGLNIQVTLSIGELRKLVELINIAEDLRLASGGEPEPVVADVSGLYYELMENLKDGYLGDFEPE